MAYTDVENAVIDRIDEFSTDAAAQVTLAQTALSNLESGISAALGSGVAYTFSGDSGSLPTSPSNSTFKLGVSLDDYGTSGFPSQVTPQRVFHEDLPDINVDSFTYPTAINGVTGLGSASVLDEVALGTPTDIEAPADLISNISDIAPTTLSATKPDDPDTMMLDPSLLPGTVTVEDITAVSEPGWSPAQVTYGADISAITADGNSIDMSPTVSGTPADISLDYTLPDELAELTLPTFDSILPTITLDELAATYSYSETAYTALIKDEMQHVLESVLGGEIVVPTSTWDALGDRAVADAERVQVAEEWAASNLAASLGMTGLPSETLLARLDTAEQKASQRISATRLELMIQEAVQRREDMWNGMKEARAYEAMWISQHDQLQGRALATAAKAHEAQVAVYNANVARFNAEVALAGVEVQYKSVELDAVKVRLEEYRTKLQRIETALRNDDNQVKLWLGKWDGWKAEEDIKVRLIEKNIDEYMSKLEGDKTRLNGDATARKSAVDVQTGNSTVYNGLIGGQATRHQADVAKEGLDLRAAETNVAIYNSHVSGEKTRLDGSVASQQMLVESGKLDIEEFKAGWGAVSTQTQYVSEFWRRSLDQYNAAINFNNGLANFNNSIAQLKNVDLASQRAVFESESNAIRLEVDVNNKMWDAVKTEQDTLAQMYAGQATKVDMNTRRRNLEYQYEQLNVSTDLKNAQETANASLRSLELSLNKSLTSIEQYARLNVGAMNAFLGASDVSLGAQAQTTASFEQSIRGECTANVTCIPT